VGYLEYYLAHNHWRHYPDPGCHALSLIVFSPQVYKLKRRVVYLHLGSRMVNIEYVKCLFCGVNRPLVTKKRGEFRLLELAIPPSEYPIIQIREARGGPGRGLRVKGKEYGFVTVGEIPIVEMLRDPRYAELAEGLKDRLLQIVRSYIEAGVIKPEEITRRRK
jgi:hypothetical protein